MKLNFKIQKTVRLDPKILVNRIVSYLKKSSYDVVEKNETSIIFNRDVYSGKKSFRSDYYTKVDDGKFEITLSEQEIIVSLVYRVSIIREIIFLLVIFVVGVAVDYKAFILSIVFIVNFTYKISYLNSNILDDAISP